MKVICVIPARYASTRLPGKPLKLIAGKPMIQRVYEQVKKARRPADCIVATDDQRVCDAVLAFGGKACLTLSLIHISKSAAFFPALPSAASRRI